MLRSLWSGLEVPETQESTAIDFSTDAYLKRKTKGAKEIWKSKHKLKIINIYLNINNLVIIRPDSSQFSFLCTRMCIRLLPSILFCQESDIKRILWHTCFCNNDAPVLYIITEFFYSSCAFLKFLQLQPAESLVCLFVFQFVCFVCFSGIIMS